MNQTSLPSFPITFAFVCDTIVQLVAEPSAGYQFETWSGALSTSENPVSLKMDADKSVTAVFKPIMHTLKISSQGSGVIYPSPGEYSYPEGEELSLSALPDTGWQFEKWLGDVANPFASTTTTRVDSDREIVAVFSAQEKGSSMIGGVIIGSILIAAGALFLMFKSRRKR